MSYFFLLFSPLFIYLFNNFIKKNSFISSYSGQEHQKFAGNKTIPLSGGIFLSFFIIYIFIDSLIFLSIFIFFTFVIGFLSDINFLPSPKFRILFQSIILFLFTYLVQIHVGKTGVYLLDIILDNVLMSYLFTTFCLLIVINGSNFIDGLNGLVIGYYLIILLIIFKLGLFTNTEIEENQLIFIIFIVFYLFLFNIFEYLYLGDSGSYVLGFIVSYILISIYQIRIISPFYVVLLLWYPCFENLFSIMRKFKIKKSPILPDTKHFHQLLYYYLNKNFLYSNHYANNLASFIIIFYNALIFMLASQYINHTQTQIFLIIFNVVVYVFVYFRLLSYRYNTD
jgi:UDP-N-acetylmuramyl pentapeptide phosphotransferase/UDP-N-acetylglucosamine-1-phosphate transferase